MTLNLNLHSKKNGEKFYSFSHQQLAHQILSIYQTYFFVSSHVIHLQKYYRFILCVTCYIYKVYSEKVYTLNQWMKYVGIERFTFWDIYIQTIQKCCMREIRKDFQWILNSAKLSTIEKFLVQPRRYKKNFLCLIRFLEVGWTKNISVWSGKGLVLPHSDQDTWVWILPWPICQRTELLAWRDEMIPVRSVFWEGPENHTTRWTKLCDWNWIGKNV